MVINPAIEVYLLDADGRILAFSAPAEKVKRNHVDLAPVHAFLHDGDRLPISSATIRATAPAARCFPPHP
jgi:hypothetical protein